jgi:hypothetical protein
MFSAVSIGRYYHSAGPLSDICELRMFSAVSIGKYYHSAGPFSDICELMGALACNMALNMATGMAKAGAATRA